MEHLLENLYYGCTPDINSMIYGSAEINGMREKRRALMEQLKSGLGGDQREKLEAIWSSWCRQMDLVVEKSFYHGFRMGMHLMLECMEEEKP